MKKIQIEIDPDISTSLAVRRIFKPHVDVTTDAEISKHQTIDEIDTMFEADVGT